MPVNNIWVENLVLEAPVKLFRACARFGASEAQEVFHNLKVGSQNYLSAHLSQNIVPQSPPIHPKP
jgi:hypothetical protein